MIPAGFRSASTRPRLFRTFFVFFLLTLELMGAPMFAETTQNASWTPDPGITDLLASQPGLLKTKLETAMRRLLNNPASLTLTVTAINEQESARGHLKGVGVQTIRGNIDNLVLESAAIEFEDVQLNTTKLVLEEKIETIRVQNINMDVIILEKDLNIFLEEKAKSIKVSRPRIDLANQRMRLSGETKYGFVKVSFWAEGGFSIKDSREIWFHPRKLKLNNMAMPRAFIGSLVKRINPVLNLEKFPFRLNLKEIIIQEGSMRFTSFRQDF